MSHQRDPDEPSSQDEPGTGQQKPIEAHLNELESRLLKGRKVMVFDQITDKLARDVVARTLALVDESNKPIHIYVNSPGGHVESGDSIHDIIKFVRSSVPICMIGTTGHRQNAEKRGHEQGRVKELRTIPQLPQSEATEKRRGAEAE